MDNRFSMPMHIGPIGRGPVLNSDNAQIMAQHQALLDAEKNISNLRKSLEDMKKEKQKLEERLQVAERVERIEEDMKTLYGLLVKNFKVPK